MKRIVLLVGASLVTIWLVGIVLTNFFNVDVDGVFRKFFPDSDDEIVEKLKKSNPVERYQLLVARGASPRIDAYLLTCAQDNDWKASILAIDLLGAIRAPDVSNQLLNMIDEKHIPKTVSIINALGMIGDRNTFGKIVELARNSTNLDIRTISFHALGEYGGPEAIGVLKDIFDKSEDITIKSKTGLELARLGNDSAYALTKSILGTEKNQDGLCRALITLSLLGSSNDLKLLDDLSHRVNLISVDSLAWMEICKIELPAKNLNDQQKNELYESLLTHRDSLVRQWAMEKLAKRDDRRTK